MPQADYINSKKNYRMEFRYGKKSFKFSINPEEYTLEEGSRSLVTQTKAGAWIDDFGGALPKIYMSGHTGVKSGGFKKFKALRDFIRTYTNDNRMAGTVTEEMYFYNYTDEDYFVVHVEPSGFKLSRSASRPLLYQYEINLIVLRKASDKAISVNFKEGAYDRGGNLSGSINGGNEVEKIQTALGHSSNTTKAGSFATDDDLIVQTGKTVLSSSASVTSRVTATGNSAKNTNKKNGKLQTFAEYTDIEEQLGYNEFLEEISLLGMQTLKHIRNGEIKDKKRASQLDPDSYPYLYYKLCKNKNIEPHIQERARVVTLELMAIAVYPDTFHTKMSEKDLEKLISNIHTLINDLSSIREYKLAQHLRDLQRCVIGLLGSNLYEKDIATKISDIKNAYFPEL